MAPLVLPVLSQALCQRTFLPLQLVLLPVDGFQAALCLVEAALEQKIKNWLGVTDPPVIASICYARAREAGDQSKRLIYPNADYCGGSKPLLCLISRFL